MNAKKRKKGTDEDLLQLGKFIYNLASLVFAGGVLTILIDYRTERITALSVSVLAFVVLVWFAWTITKRGNIKR